jgi:hypothetical protein
MEILITHFSTETNSHPLPRLVDVTSPRRLLAIGCNLLSVD